MRVSIEKRFQLEEAFDWLRAARLEGEADSPHFYQHAYLRGVTLRPDDVNPSAMYVLESRLRFQANLRSHLLETAGIDTLRLQEVLHLRDETSGVVFGMAPPYVEVVSEAVAILPRPQDREAPPPQRLRMLLLIDGIHRFWLARELDLSVSVVLVSDAPSEFPYRAYPCDWDVVRVTDVVPSSDKKRFYRFPERYQHVRPLDSLRGIRPNFPEYGR